MIKEDKHSQFYSPSLDRGWPSPSPFSTASVIIFVVTIVVVAVLGVVVVVTVKEGHSSLEIRCNALEHGRSEVMWVLGGAVGVVDEVAMGSATSVGAKRWDSMVRASDESAMEVV